MRTNLVLSRLLMLVIVMLSGMSSGLLAQHLSENVHYSVEPSCVSPSSNKPTLESQYFYLLTISELVDSEEHLEIVIDGQALTQFHVTQEDLPYSRVVGPFSHSGVGGSFHEYILRSLENTVSDTLYLSELVCGYSTSNGLNRAGYYCSGAAHGVIAQSAPEKYEGPQLPEKTYVYTLIHRTSSLVRAKNFSGHFTGVEDLENYEIHAFATSFEESSTFINNIIIGQELDQSNLSFCFGLCGVFPVDVDCSSFDLALEKRVRGGLVHSIGDTVVYDIIITNQGRVTAYNIVVADLKPEVLRFETDLNPDWNANLTSKSIPALEAGASHSIPITMIVGATGGFIEVENIAEIIQTNNDLDKDVTAFDVDSTPNNKSDDEDDLDGAIIVIIENLCDATFLMQLMKEPVCAGSPIEMSAMITMSNGGLEYFWQYDGEIISFDSILSIPNHTVADYGTYGLTVLDAMGCTSTEYITIEPIDNSNRPSCFSDIYVGINERCEMFLRPSMFTNRQVPAIEDYIIEIRDEDEHIIDQSNLWQYSSGTILEGRLINPCTDEVLCWSNLHIEHKGKPQGNIIVGNFTTTCGELSTKSPSEIINEFTQKHPYSILSKQEYKDTLDQLSCLQEWDVEIIDLYVDGVSSCEDPAVHRIYSIYDQEQRINLDTAILTIEKVEVSEIKGPEDVDNLSCVSGYDPESLNSYPFYIIGSDTIQLRGEINGGNGSICQVAASYSDQYIGENCNFGVNKIMRVWSISDWCTNQLFQSIQFIYVVDVDAPIWNTTDTIVVEVAPFACSARVDLSKYINVRDDCDQSPEIVIKGDEETDIVMDFSLGRHNVILLASDRCGNTSEWEVQLEIVENSPPVPILNQDIVIGITEDIGVYTNFVLASHIDAESHDHGCGPVEVSIAREGEVAIIKGAGGSINIDEELYNCELENSKFDNNNNGRVSLGEIYRDRVVFCCQDIGQLIPISVRVSDMSGNLTYATTIVEVQAIREYVLCDDGDPCTMNDRAYGDCPCKGSLILRDEDNDGIVDCQDEAIQFCLLGEPIIVQFSQIDSILNAGATGGACYGAAQIARIAGNAVTPSGEMIENVTITSNNFATATTGGNGHYIFEHNPMYQRYHLEPYKNDDPLNGVSSQDLLLLQEYLIGLRSLSDPYIQIAADINNDGAITALDLVDLRKVLLGYEPDFPSNDSWRFIIKDFQWEDIRNPFDFDEINVISSLDQDYMDEDWIGIKIGDLSGDVRANVNTKYAEVRTKRNLTLSTQNQNLVKGKKYLISFSVSQKEHLKALQMGLIGDGIKIAGVQSELLSLSPEHINLQATASELAIVWFDTEAMKSQEVLLEVEIEALRDGKLSDMLSLNKNNPEALYFNQNLDEGTILLNFTKGTSTREQRQLSKMYQNQPNPFNGETLIQFSLPNAGRVRFEFYSVDGKALHHIEDEFGEGINALTIRPEVFRGYSGIVYYQMTVGKEQHTKTMIVNKE